MTSKTTGLVNEQQQLVDTLPHLGGLTKDLLYMMGVPPQPRFLAAAVLRLRSLLYEHGNIFVEVLTGRLSINALDKWLDAVRSMPPGSFTPAVVASPMLSAQARHPLNGYCLTDFPLYTVILTTRQDGPLRRSHDRLCAAFVNDAMLHHLQIERETWFAFIQNWHDLHTTSAEDSDRSIPVVAHPVTYIASMRTASLAIRTQQYVDEPLGFLAALASSKSHPSDFIHQQLAKLEPLAPDGRLASLQSFLSERYRGSRTPGEEKKSKERGRDKGNPPQKPIQYRMREGEFGTFLSFHTFLLEAPPNTPTLLPPTYTEAELEQAILLDVPIEEIADASDLFAETLQDENQVQDDLGLAVRSHNQIQWLRKDAEYQLYTPSYVSRDQLGLVVDRLQLQVAGALARSAIKPVPSLASALLLMVAIGTGRPISSILSSFSLLDAFPIETAEAMIPINITVIYDLSLAALHVRVPTPTLVNRNAPAGARPVRDWLTLPDCFGLQGGMRTWHQYPVNDQAAFLEAVEARIAESLGIINRDYGITESQLWQQLPRALLQRTGYFATGALITDWTPLNRADLHYLSPRADVLLERYLDAMRHLFPNLPEFPAVAGEYYVGMRNCPEVGYVQRLVGAILAKAAEPEQPDKHFHNLIALYTILMASFAVGLRHAINIMPGGRELIGYDVGHFQEKGKTRLLVLPTLLAAQFRAYDRHREAVSAQEGMVEALKAIGDPQIFLFDADGKPTEFHPTRFHEYLLALNRPGETVLQFEPPLNSLRRLLYTRLLEEGTQGPVVDSYISHQAEGRAPFAPGSGMSIQPLAELAGKVDAMLAVDGWRVIEGYQLDARPH